MMFLDFDSISRVDGNYEYMQSKFKTEEYVNSFVKNVRMHYVIMCNRQKPYYENIK